MDTGCDQPPVYVLTDCEAREDIQQVASTNSEKRHSMDTEHDVISSSGNFDAYPDEEYSDNERVDDVAALDNEKVSILGHSGRFRTRQKRTSLGSLPYGKEDGNDLARPEPFPDSRDGLIPIKEEPPYGFHRNDVIHHEHPPPPHGYIPVDKTVGEPYNYRISLSPTSTRADFPTHDPHVSSQVSRNSLSPQEPMVTTYGDISQPKKAYYCYLCGKEYRSGTGLKQHLLAHKNEKPFGCTLCHRRYRWKGDLNRHMYTHLPNDELPLKCPECQKGFVRKDKMQLHINFAHGGGSAANGNSEEPTKEQNTPPSFSSSAVSSDEQSLNNKEINGTPSQG